MNDLQRCGKCIWFGKCCDALRSSYDGGPVFLDCERCDQYTPAEPDTDGYVEENRAAYEEAFWRYADEYN